MYNLVEPVKMEVSNKELSPANLHLYQKKAIKFTLKRRSCALFLDLGLGKTVITLSALKVLIKAKDSGRILILAPKRVIETVWRQEALKWSHTKSLTFSTITGTAAQRIQALQADADIHLINYENLTWMIEKSGVMFRFDTVVFDEFSLMKSASAKRFKSYKSIMHKVYRVIGLTGTPASNGLLDLYGQMFIIDKGQRLGKTYYNFRARFFYSDYSGYKWRVLPGNDEVIHGLIKDVCLSLSCEDYLKMPKRIDNVIEVEMPPSARLKYKNLEKDYLITYGDGSETLQIKNAAALSNKLLQFANGAIYVDDKHNWEPMHKAKLDALDDLIEETAGQPVLVVYNYQSDKERLMKKFKHAVCIKEKGAIDKWNKGEIQLLIAHPKNAGYGLNLQAGGNIIVWFGMNWSLELYSQMNARIYRQGQDKPVFIHHLIVKRSVDGTVLKALRNKDITQKSLLDALKRDIKGHTKRAAPRLDVHDQEAVCAVGIRNRAGAF